MTPNPARRPVYVRPTGRALRVLVAAEYRVECERFDRGLAPRPVIPQPRPSGRGRPERRAVSTRDVQAAAYGLCTVSILATAVTLAGTGVAGAALAVAAWLGFDAFVAAGRTFATASRSAPPRPDVQPRHPVT